MKMDLILEHLENGSDKSDEEEDYANFFLQPASSPYNIAEKIQQANIDLTKISPMAAEKTSRVTFKPEIASFEPEELTDDDVNSLESDLAEAPELKTGQKIINLAAFFGADVDEEDTEISEEEIATDPEDILDTPKCPNFNTPEEKCDEEIPQEEPRKHQKVFRNKRPPRRKIVEHVECRSHCIERLPDFDLSISIKKLELRDKPSCCPLLKLQARKCCDENKSKNPQNLPVYNGLRSEYGLSSSQLEKREKVKQIMREKQKKRALIREEYKKRKSEQNEAVFCQWLREVQSRRSNPDSCSRISRLSKPCLSPSVVSFPPDERAPSGGRMNARPRTANEFVPKQGIKRARRPYTAACVFIQVPDRLLQRGIRLGDLLVTDSTFASKKMHILTVSK